mmetsp:Transcript_18085/g.35496  ORF Transcript_18085/g.35496 Transcript_18085/m.35496 type:complete len:84 (+) Transcript_18085:32-283(+)
MEVERVVKDVNLFFTSSSFGRCLRQNCQAIFSLKITGFAELNFVSTFADGCLSRSQASEDLPTSGLKEGFSPDQPGRVLFFFL